MNESGFPTPTGYQRIRGELLKLEIRISATTVRTILLRQPGKSADLAIWRIRTHRQIPYWPAADLVRTVVKCGAIVFDRD